MNILSENDGCWLTEKQEKELHLLDFKAITS